MNKIKWRNDCLAKPFGDVDLATNGIATSLTGLCENKEHVTAVQPTCTSLDSVDNRQLSCWELNCQLIGAMQSIGCGGVHAENVLAHLGLPFCTKLHKDGFSNLQEDMWKKQKDM